MSRELGLFNSIWSAPPYPELTLITKPYILEDLEAVIRRHLNPVAIHSYATAKAD